MYFLQFISRLSTPLFAKGGVNPFDHRGSGNVLIHLYGAPPGNHRPRAFQQYIHIQK